MSSAAAKIGIISIGDMGVGIAKLLIANGFSVATNCKGRSNDTIERAKNAKVELLNSDEALTQACSVILSVVPPRDAYQTAQRIVDAVTGPLKREEPLYFAELNAVAPSSVRKSVDLFEKARANVHVVDGCILGSPPAANEDGTWSRPSIPTSGPHKLSDIPGYGEKLFSTLNMKHINQDIGAASGLKMCFATMTKAYSSLVIQSITTAQRMGVLDELKHEIETMIPNHWKVSQGVSSVPPKAWRWVAEMEEIAKTFEEEAGFPQDSLRGAAKVFQAVADDPVLGQEKIGKRKRGTTLEDVAIAMADGLEKKQKKNV